jgi:NAD(P)-dependent dehydrogenase (short-subunit alcohol dehydrogenase family)
MAQSMARELGPKNIHVAHLVIDSSVDTEWVRQLIANREGAQAIADLDPNRLMRPAAVAEAYWQLYQQPRDAWTFEHEIRPFGEKRQKQPRRCPQCEPRGTWKRRTDRA